MTAHGNNATAPSPAIAPGAETIDAAAFARALSARWPGNNGVDPRLKLVIPTLDAPFFQAGLAGYSDAAMRLVARRQGCPLCVTEALLDRMLLGGGHGFHKADLGLQANRLLHGRRPISAPLSDDERLISDNLPTGGDDHPLIGQLIGSDPDEMAAAAVKMYEQGSRHSRAYREMAYAEGVQPPTADTRWHVTDAASGSSTAAEGSCEDDCTPESLLVPEQYDPAMVFATESDDNAPEFWVQGQTERPASVTQSSFATIDVNLACPVKKVDRKSRGGHWLSQPEGALAILRAVREALPREVPCTVKLRRGYDDTPEMAKNLEVIFNGAYELGYAFATVHARTVEQKYLGPSRWTFLRDLASRHKDKVIFGSGDIWQASDIFTMMAYTGVAGVSVARGCIGNPWIFRQARQMLAGAVVTSPTLGEQRAVLMEHFTLSVRLNGEALAGRLMRKFGIKFAQHHPDPESVKRRMCAVASTKDWLATLDELYPAAIAVAGSPTSHTSR